MTLSVIDTQHNYALHFAVCRILFIVMLSVLVVTVVMLIVFMLIVVAQQK